MLQLSEVSHSFRGDSYCYGGSYYCRSHAQNVLIFTSGGDSPITVKLKPVNDNSIDYYLPVVGEFPVSSVVVSCFHTWIFATRNDVVLASGTQHGVTEIVARYDSLGNILEG